MVKQVISGNPNNVKARVARFYWLRLYQDLTRKDAEDYLALKILTTGLPEL